MADITEKLEEALQSDDVALTGTTISPSSQSISRASPVEQVDALAKAKRLQARTSGGVIRARARFYE